MAGLDLAADDLVTHEVAVAALDREIDRRRCAFLAAVQFTQVDRLAEPALGVADQHEGEAVLDQARARRGRDVVDHADRTDGRRRQDRTAFGLVVERDVARHDREVERAAGLGHAHDGTRELAHDLGLLRVAEVHVVGDGERPRADGRDVAPRLGHGLAAAGLGMGLHVARRAVGGHGEALVARALVSGFLRGPGHAHQRRVAALRADRGVAQDEMVVLMPDPRLAREIGATHQLHQRGLPVGRRVARRGHPGRIELGRQRRQRPRALVHRRLGDQRRDRDVAHHLAVPGQHHALGVGEMADHREVEFPLLEDRARLVLAAGLQHHEHALLALRQHQLVGIHAGLAHRHLVEFHDEAEAALGRHLERGGGEAGRAHVLDGDDGVGRHQLEAGFQQQLLDERVADLHRRALALAVLVEFGRGHGGAMDAVATGLGADIDHRIADAGGGRIEDLVDRRDAHGHGVDQDVAVVGGMEVGLAADRRNAHAVAVARDAGHHARDEMARPGVLRVAEAQRVEVGHRPRAHREDVAHDAAHARRRTLVGLDVGGVVVALHLEDGGLAVADVDDAGILARALDDPRRLGRQLLQPHLRGLVGAVLAPHGREDAEFHHGGIAAHDLQQALVFVRRQPVLGNDLRRDRRLVRQLDRRVLFLGNSHEKFLTKALRPCPRTGRDRRCRRTSAPPRSPDGASGPAPSWSR